MDFSFGGIKPLYYIFSYCLPEAATVRPRPAVAVVAMPRFDPQGAANFSFPSSGAKVRPAAAAH